jgi:hypothetical protein
MLLRHSYATEELTHVQREFIPFMEADIPALGLRNHGFDEALGDLTPGLAGRGQHKDIDCH